MVRQSAGILLYRRTPKDIEVLLVHPGGPFWKNKDDGVWSIPKGEIEDDEVALGVAVREFEEETGFKVQGPFWELGSIRQKGGKLVSAWACEGSIDVRAILCNTFELEWPPGSGIRKTFPEIDRGAYFNLAEARLKLNTAQIEFLERLEKLLNEES